jgi:hypothetical protein
MEFPSGKAVMAARHSKLKSFVRNFSNSGRISVTISESSGGAGSAGTIGAAVGEAS